MTAPDHILTVSDLDGPSRYGVRTSSAPEMVDTAVLGELGELASRGEFSVPIAGTYEVGAWRDAMELSRSGHAHGKLVLLLDARDR